MEGICALFRNKHSNLYLNVMGYSKQELARIEQWTLQTDDSRASQAWYLFPVDCRAYLIVNKYSGLVLSVRGKAIAFGSLGNESNIKWQELYEKPARRTLKSFSFSDGTLMEQRGLNDKLEYAQTWRINAKSGDEDNDKCLVQNTMSNKFLCVVDNSVENAARIEQRILLEDSPDQDAQMWILELERKFPTAVEAYKDVEHEVDDIGDVIRMINCCIPSPTKTEEVLVGLLVLPFPLVKDKDMDPVNQAANNPYYFLHRFGYWKMVDYHDNKDKKKITEKDSEKVGLITNNRQEVEKTIGVIIKEDASFALKDPAHYLYANKFRRDLKVTVPAKPAAASTPAGPAPQLSRMLDNPSKMMRVDKEELLKCRWSKAIWFREDHYILERMDGSTLLEWTIRDPGKTVTDTYSSDST